MKRLLLPLVTLLAIGCAQPLEVDGVQFGSYGLANEAEMKNPDLRYEVIVGNVIWGVLLCETVIAPIYFFGWSLYQPVGKKSPNHVPGQISG